MFFFQLPYLPEYVLEMDDFKVFDEGFGVMIVAFNFMLLKLKCLIVPMMISIILILSLFSVSF